MLIHFKVETCSSIDPATVCRDVFGENRHLCVLHSGKHENPHWHFQGESDMKEIDAYIKRMCENHSKRIAAPSSRPAKRSKSEKKPVTEDGYQYMCKETPPRVVTGSSDFTPEVIEQLHAASEGHVAELKNQMYFYILEQITKKRFVYNVECDWCKETHANFRYYGLEYYTSNDKMPPPNFQKLVLWYMTKYYTHTHKKHADVMSYVSERM